MNKKAYMRTLEAFSAVVLTFMFMTYVIPQFQGNEIRRQNIDIVGSVILDDQFRDCTMLPVIADAENCAKNSIHDFFPQTYNFTVEISNSRQFNPSDLPKTRIFSESAMIASNMSVYYPRYVRVYYWLKK